MISFIRSIRITLRRRCHPLASFTTCSRDVYEVDGAEQQPSSAVGRNSYSDPNRLKPAGADECPIVTISRCRCAVTTTFPTP